MFANNDCRLDDVADNNLIAPIDIVALHSDFDRLGDAVRSAPAEF